MDTTLIVAIVAIIAPILTSIVSGIKEYNIAKVTSSYNSKFETFKMFSDTYLQWSDAQSVEGYQASFLKSATLTLIFCDNPKTIEYIKKLIYQVQHGNDHIEIVNSLFIECMLLLSKE